MDEVLVGDPEGNVAIVTGGGTGIGHVCATALVQRGAKVVVNYNRAPRDAGQTAQAEDGGASVADAREHFAPYFRTYAGHPPSGSGA